VPDNATSFEVTHFRCRTSGERGGHGKASG
jgi:hypothetical protein